MLHLNSLFILQNGDNSWLIALSYNYNVVYLVVDKPQEMQIMGFYFLVNSCRVQQLCQHNHMPGNYSINQRAK